jgi:hypothetical protein
MEFEQLLVGVTVVFLSAAFFALYMHNDRRRRHDAALRLASSAAAAQTNHKPATPELDLSQNDIIVLYMAYRDSGGVSETRTAGLLLGESQRGWESRLKRLMTLGLVQTSAFSDSKGRNSIILTDEGEAVGRLIERFSRPLLQLERMGKLRAAPPVDSTTETPPAAS